MKWRGITQNWLSSCFHNPSIANGLSACQMLHSACMIAIIEFCLSFDIWTDLSMLMVNNTGSRFGYVVLMFSIKSQFEVLMRSNTIKTPWQCGLCLESAEFIHAMGLSWLRNHNEYWISRITPRYSSQWSTPSVITLVCNHRLNQVRWLAESCPNQANMHWQGWI